MAIRTVTAALLLMLCSPVLSQTWNTPVTIPDPSNTTGGDLGQYNSMAIINGNPAIATRNSTNTSVVFMRAADADGTTWNSMVTVDAEASVGEYACLLVVNGNPAIAYFDQSNGDLKYARANDINGTSWGTPIVIGGTNIVGRYLSMKIINGNPAISYRDNTTGFLKYVRATDVNGTTWGTKVNVYTTGLPGFYTSLEDVNGYPAISYYDDTNDDLVFVRATDADGTAWGTPSIIDGTGQVGTFSCMKIINGNPAIAYHDVTNLDLKYIRATDVNGTTWGTAQTLDATGTIANSPLWMTVINGNPTIAYYDATNGDLKYIRASDVSGSTWGTAQTIDATNNVGQYTSIEEVNGYPAIAYYDVTNTNLKYIRATDIDGSTWGTALSFDAGTATGTHTSMQLANGKPIMAYYDAAAQDLKIIRATSSSGASWNTVQTIDATGDVGLYTSMAIVNGNPAIAYYDVTNGNLKYVRAMDADGTTWGSPVVVDGASSDVGQYTSMVMVNGNPAIAYYDVTNTNLKYIRATDANGTTWGSPVTADATSTAGQYNSMVVVNGNPAIAYYYSSGADLKYVRASDADGTTWNTALTLESTNSTGTYARMAMVNGNPAIAYHLFTSGDLKYIRATDASGTTWGSAVAVITSGTVGNHIALAVINGKPAIACADYSILNGTLLKYVRATNANGSTWGAASTIDAGGATYTNMLYSGTDVYLGYYQPGMQVPAFLKGAITSFEWTGAASTTDWFTASNWEGSIVPTTNYDAVIPGSLSFYPNISSGTASCNALSISTGGTLTISSTGNLQIAGTISNSGTFNATDGTVTLNGGSVQTIPASVFSTNTIKNLTLNNSSGTTLAGTLNITGTYTPTSGVFTTGGFLVLKSDASGTARIAAGSSGGGYISGNATVERYIPARRAWRFLTAPLTGSSNNSVFYNWQNNDNVIANTGVELWTTWANGGVSDPSSANSGLGASTGNSIRSYISNSGWNAITNTNTTELFSSTVNNSYCVFVTGPYGNGSGNISSGATATALKASGTLRQGDIIISAGSLNTNQFYLVGNPFAAPVDPNLLSGSNLSNSFWMWDPNLTGTYGTGGYVTYNRTLNQYNVTTASYSNAPVSHIQSGQAFFIRALATATTSITFEEADKSTTVNNGQFRTTANGFENLRVTLQRDFEGTNSFMSTDAVVASYHASIGSKDIDDYDVNKLNNSNDNLSLLRNGTDLTFEHRPITNTYDTLYLKLGATVPANYRFVIAPEDFAVMAGMTAILKDQFLNTETPISLTANTTVDFTVTSNAATTGQRFVIYFRPSGPLPVDFISLNVTTIAGSIQLNWKVAAEKNVVRYEVERSNNGSSFEKLGSVAATRADAYRYTDASPFSGVNYYRIRSVDANGQYTFSNIVQVKTEKEQSITIYPNPVKGQAFDVRIAGGTAGKYRVRIINAAGQVVLTTAFDYGSGVLLQRIALPASVVPGIYQVAIDANDNTGMVQSLIIR